MKVYKILTTDVKKGIPVSADKDLKVFKDRFADFSERIEHIYEDYLT